MAWQRREETANGDGWEIVRQVFAPEPKVTIQQTGDGNVIPSGMNKIEQMVANGAKQFTSHEDVIKKLLGR